MTLAFLRKTNAASPSVIELQAALGNVQKFLETRLKGQESVIELVLTTFIAGGHLLLEGPPGVGKTSLARGLSEAFAGSFRRVQMTSDLLPSEIVGILRPAQDGIEFEFRPGPIFANFLLIDELNRTSPKTQAALLEAMAEGRATVDGKGYPLPNPYFVVATQNPHEFHGVYPLAESQLDRFMLQVRMDLPNPSREMEIYKGGFDTEKPISSDQVIELSQLKIIRDEAARVHVSDEVMNYVHQVISATRSHSGIDSGASIRGGLLFVSALRAYAFLKKRDYVRPSDVKELAVPALAHRLRLDNGGWEWEAKRKIVEDILTSVQAPK